MSRITVTPTTNYAGATDFGGNSIAKPTVEYLDASDTALTDADTASTETFEVALSVGANAIKVKVTAADGTTTNTYTVTVTRAAASVEAQVGTFVTNYGQVDLSDQAENTSTGTSRAQQFTVGSHAAGYLLDGIDMTVTTTGSATYSAYLCAVGTDGFPLVRPTNLSTATSCVSLTKPTSGNKYTPPANTYLASGRTYSIIAAKTGRTGRVIVNATWKDAEDATPAAGWSIGNSYDYGSSNGREWGTSSVTQHVTLGAVTRALRIAVKGTTRSASTDATLSALALSEGTLSPGFSPAGTSYTASVGNAVSRITVTPTTNYAGATDFGGNSIAKPTVEYLDASDTALTDADTASTETFEVALSVGANAIKVKVTAGGRDHDEYLHGNRDARGGIGRSASGHVRHQLRTG